MNAREPKQTTTTGTDSKSASGFTMRLGEPWETKLRDKAKDEGCGVSTYARMLVIKGLKTPQFRKARQ